MVGIRRIEMKEPRTLKQVLNLAKPPRFELWIRYNPLEVEQENDWPLIDQAKKLGYIELLSKDQEFTHGGFIYKYKLTSLGTVYCKE